MTTQPVAPWPGNLPCCHGPMDGCEAHNPTRIPMFWDPSLATSVRPVNSGVFAAIFSALKAGRKECEANQPTSPRVTSILPRSETTCTPLPLVHPSVPYELCFYHIFSAMSPTMAPADGGSRPGLDVLTCNAIHGSRPQITWSIAPKIVDGRFLIEHSYTFLIGVEHSPTSSTRGYYSKRWFLSRGFRSFSPCLHCRRIMRSVTETVDRHGVRSLRLAYALVNVLGQEFRDEWRSSVGRQPVNMSCGMCYTDFSMRLEEHGQQAIRVRLWVHKDLGGITESRGPDERWTAAAGVTSLDRPKSDFGRIRRAFEEQPSPNGEWRQC